MRSITYALPALPGFAGPKTYAAWPVWRDSTTSDVKFHPMPKKQAVKLYWEAVRFERQTRRPGRQDGALGRNGLAVLHAMLFDILNYATGRLDPGYEKIANKACISIRSAARGLANLRRAGVLHWQKRSRPISDERGGFLLKQDTNAYAVLAVSLWRGFWRRPEAPPPDPTCWGATPPLPDQLSQATADLAAGDSTDAVIRRLADDLGDELACRLASYGRAMLEANK